MKFQAELFSVELCKEVWPLLQQHYQEIAVYKDIPLDPQWEWYERVQEMGILKVYTVRTDEGKLVGYATYLVQNNKHYRSSLQAAADVFFIDKAHRSMVLVAKRFILFCDEELGKLGVEIVYHRYKLHQPALGNLLEKVGYEEIEVNMARRLK